MTVLHTFRECSILLPVFDKPVRNFEKTENRVKSFVDASEMIDFIGRAPIGANFVEILFDRCTTIKQIRVLVAFILQPEMELPKIVPEPRINTKKDESSQTHLAVFTTLQSFRD